jgi:hypothetical protein
LAGQGKEQTMEMSFGLIGIIAILLVLVVIAALVVAVYFFMRGRDK